MNTMQLRGVGILATALIFQIVIAWICVAEGIGTTGGLTLNSAVPASGWDVLIGGLSWFGSAMTFQLSNAPSFLSLVMWLLTVFDVIGVIAIWRGA